MKLAEARSRVLELNERIDGLRERIRSGPLNAISSILGEVNDAATERQHLQVAIAQTEADTIVAGSSLRDLLFVVQAVENKIATLMDLKQRSDLTPEITDNIFEQVAAFSKIKNQLKNTLERTSWQVDVVV